MVQQQIGCHFDSQVTTVTTAGTRVQITANPDHITRITFKALTTNTGDIYVGGSSVSSTVGHTLAPGESVALDFSPNTEVLSNFWVDAAVNGEKVSWIIGAVAAAGTLSGSHTHDSHTGTLSVNEGGTGATSHTDGGLLIGKGTAAVENTGVLADGTIVIGDGTTNPTTLAALTASGGTLKHEYGGLEFDLSAVTTGDTLVGQSAGVVGLETAMSQAQAEAGTDTQVRGVTAQRIKQAIDALGGSGVAQTARDFALIRKFA